MVHSFSVGAGVGMAVVGGDVGPGVGTAVGTPVSLVGDAVGSAVEQVAAMIARSMGFVGNVRQILASASYPINLTGPAELWTRVWQSSKNRGNT